MKKKRVLRVTALLLMTALLVSLSVSQNASADTPAATALYKEDDYSPSTMTDEERAAQPGLGDMTWVAENDSLAMYIDEEETDVAVVVKATGDVWYSNPPDAEDDPIASDYNRRQLKSQIQLQYYNESVQLNLMDNYSDSVQYGAFEIQYLTDGVSILYHLGTAGSQRILPEVISVERLEEFASRLDSSDSKKLLRNYTKLDKDELSEADYKEYLETYPSLADFPIYIIRSSVKDYIRDQLAEYLAEAGYTEEDLDYDLTENGYSTEDTSAWFDVPMTYRLSGENLMVEVDPDSIVYNTDGYYLTTVSLMPFFGAAGTDEEGYIFVPDGCGALINLNNGSTYTYSAMVYGTDATMNALLESQSEVDQNLTIKMPVFGLKSGDTAWYCIIDDGDAYASVNATVSGTLTSYNSVYPSFQYLEYGESSLTGMVGSNSFQMYSEAGFSGRYRLRFSFLNGGAATYAGMANGYRTYLLDNGVLGNRVEATDVPFYAEMLGAIDTYATFLGVKYSSVVPVTTYAEASEIVDELISGGVKNLNVVYSGWAKGGLHGGPYTSLSSLKKLNQGGMSQKEFLEEMSSKDVDTFLTLQLQYVYDDGLFDGYSPMSNAPKYFDRSNVTQGVYYLSNNKRDDEQEIDLISPYFVDSVAQKVIKKLSNVNAGINLGTISWNLYTDQLTERYTDRQQAALYNQAAVDRLNNSFEGMVLGDNVNAYILGNVNEMINAPMDSNRTRIIDETVPFYEMVIHGYIEFAGDMLNMSDDYQTTLLKSIESGAGLYFQWIYEDNSVMKETDFENLYSVNYSAWIDRALEDYKTVNEALGSLQSQTIVDHEIVSDDVVRVTYEKGTQVLVNYTHEDVVVDGVQVAARSFAVVEA